MLTVKTQSKNKVYKVYAENESVAINQFINMCNNYKSGSNIDNQMHWQEQQDAILDKNYTIFEMEDFCGVREIV